ncbi:helicase-related protein [Sphingoaurantiacus capsulatus]|uniref:Helicase-related protein n=1 Tax=Sphingoaurantiacus capsulatus TaxID=1771310 RepID=A0ABV7X6G4_9SPHN
MSGLLRATLTAVLGPTNTGKTHLAVERMCGHASGMMGFPLRLLAREVYDRVVKIKGANQVALITGEEKILPEGARYFLCTAESMPTDREVAFVGLDEAQTGADLERGHVFTDRLLHRRGYAETMILGSETLRPLIRRLLPDAEIVTRPRFSTLSYAGPKKLSRLPKRTAIVAFSAEDVYALAEMLRRHKGGAAVVMGGLSPRTRNAQVELYQSGEVDYLVATDAIGMGLNMDIAHVAFASLSKFDGHRHRRLSTAEMAQIAGRAGRYQKDGSFGMVQLGTEEVRGFEPEEIEAIENHVFPPLSQLVWRNARLDFATLPRLIGSLDERPTTPELFRAHDAVDLAVLKSLAQDPAVADRAKGHARMQRLWAACSLPDYRKTGPEQHARLVGRVFRHLTEGDGKLPGEWIAAEVANLDNVNGDIATIADRISAARTWTYVAHRGDWVEDTTLWAERTRALEDKLSDALHQRLTQRFVDRRTAVLLRDLKIRDRDFGVEIDGDGSVAVEGEVIGTLHGFRFKADPTARAGEKRLLLAAAERRLTGELAKRARLLAEAADGAFELAFDGDMPPRILWNGARIGSMVQGRDALNPKVELDRSLAALTAGDRALVRARLDAWFATQCEQQLGALVRVAALGGADGAVSPAARGLIVQLVENLGCLVRERVASQIAALDKTDRRMLTAAGVRIGAAHVFVKDVLRPEPTRWRLALWAVSRGVEAAPPPPPAGRVTIEVEATAPKDFYDVAGFWVIDGQAVRIDMVERLARAMHQKRDGRSAFIPDDMWVASVGMRREGFARLMRALGYRLKSVEGRTAFEWRGPRSDGQRPAARPLSEHSPFAVLAGMRRG